MAWNGLFVTEPVKFKKRYRSPRLDRKLDCDYAICGAHADAHYFPERTTKVLDILICTKDRSLAQSTLKKKSTHYDYFWTSHDFFILRWSRQYLSLINSEEEWVENGIKEAQDNKGAYGEPTLTFPFLILSKLWVGSRQGYMDVARLISRADQLQLQQTKEVVEQYLPSALQELRVLYKVGKAEIKNAPHPLRYLNKPNSFSLWHIQNAEDAIIENII